MTSSRDVDTRSDIFSLGALLYRLVGGRTAYRGNSVVTILATMATDGLVPLRTLAPDAPASFAATVERCLAQDKAVRFPTVAHLAHALMPYASRRGRVSIEQILATLGVDIPDDPRSEPRQRAPLGPSLSRTDLPPAPVAGPPPPAIPPSARSSEHATGSQLTSSGPVSRPPTFIREKPRMNAARLTLLIGAAGLLALLLAFVVWRALR